MPKRDGSSKGTDPLLTGQIYHLYNRGIGGQVIFPDTEAFAYFIRLLDHCKKFTTSLSTHAGLARLYGEDKFRLHPPGTPGNPRRLMEVPARLHAYTLMPTHFHLLIEQLIDGGIAEYVGRVCNSFTKAFNERFKRHGPLWQGRFKTCSIENDPSYLQVIRYIHLNPLHSSYLKVKKLEDYMFSSYPTAAGMRDETICDHSFLRKLISAPKEYEEFVAAGISESEAKLLEKLPLEEFFAD